MLELTKPVYSVEYRHVKMALEALDRSAMCVLSAEDYQRFLEPWFPPDQT